VALAQGFQLVDDSLNRLTITVNGTRRAAENAFDVRLDDYREGDRIFYSNDRDPGCRQISLLVCKQ
jgi:hypothetical protein